MKKLIILSLCFVLLSSKCKKEQPKDHLVGSWGVLTYKDGGVDKTSDFNVNYQGYKITFDAKGNYTTFYRNLFGAETTITGTWTLESNNAQLVLVDNNPNSTSKLTTYTILSPITDTELNVGETTHEYDLRKQ